MRIFNVTLILLISLTATLAIGQTIFDQNFDMGNANGYSPDAHPWHVTPNGEYSVQNDGYETFAWSYAGDPLWSDYIYSYDLKSLSSVNQLSAFRVSSPGNCYVVNMRADPWNDIILTKWTNGTQNHVMGFPFANTGEIWHHFDIKVTGAEIAVYVDEQYLFTYTDNSGVPHLFGGIAAVSYSGGVVQSQTLFMDNVIVSADAVSSKNVSWAGVKAIFR